LTGEGALVDPSKIRSAGIRCVTPVHVIEVSREYFEKYMNEDCDLKVNLREVHNSRKRQRANAFLQLQQSLEEKVFARGEFLYKEGEPGNELYILEEGQVDTTVNGHKVFSVNQRGDIVGESAIIFHRPRNVSAQCRSPQCKLHVLRADDFHKIAETHPALKESVRHVALRREFQKGVCVKSQKPFPETENELRLAFDAVDIDKSGKLELRNVRNLIKRLDSRITDQEIHEILKSLDLDESGEVSWDEFKVIFGMGSG
jgi:CRP/FNR family transcriptional regulator, cyclic AMP receptor protein